MHLVNLTTAKNILVLIVACSLGFTAKAQQNSPYSRYGLGDLSASRNISVRGLGGISAAYNPSQSINFVNPASYGSLATTTFDIGIESGFKTLKSLNPPDKFSSSNALFSYLQLAFPVKMKKANRRGTSLGINIGLKPVSLINYTVVSRGHIENAGDSIETTYEGSGGLNQVYAGAGLRIKRFSIGFNAGYMFGNKNYSTKLNFLNDSAFHYRSNSATQTHYGNVFINGGIQYEMRLDTVGTHKYKNKRLKLGIYGNLQQNLKASQDIIRETIATSSTGEDITVDSVYAEKNVKGNIVYPASIGFGAIYQNTHWMTGFDVEMTNWSAYRYYGQKDLLQNSWKVRGGAEFLPLIDGKKSYFNYVTYRAGFYYGNDYIKVDNTLPEYAFTFGFGLPLKLRRSFYGDNQSSLLNTSFEIGSRGNKNSNLRESFFRVGIGLSLSDIWFIRRKYD